jgi:hypothetical protein
VVFGVIGCNAGGRSRDPLNFPSIHPITIRVNVDVKTIGLLISGTNRR